MTYGNPSRRDAWGPAEPQSANRRTSSWYAIQQRIGCEIKKRDPSSTCRQIPFSKQTSSALTCVGAGELMEHERSDGLRTGLAQQRADNSERPARERGVVDEQHALA